MLRLVDIKKDYYAAGETVHALKGISLDFRRNEFVSILGASGCGKTTLLNIIGGLDKYTSGDLVIEGVSTKQFGDRDWDTYRNHCIGFIFQSYHLIPHQTVLQNVELALTISGVSKEERRRRAIEALERVGLGDKLKNRPNQLSGGQAQRVAIARALINDPEVVLADEPTGALDSKTSVQIMELLKEISRDRLVIMVTHNPELAETYSTRIIRLLDGLVTDDSMPYDGTEDGDNVPAAAHREARPKNKGKKKKSSMSTGMAFMLSLKNLLSKRRRTIMVSVAGSIGIIGVSLVLAVSSGVKGYIAEMEDDMLSGYPLTISETAVDIDSLMNMTSTVKPDLTRLSDRVYINSLIDSLMALDGAITTNTITETYVKYVGEMPSSYYNAMQLDYGYNPANSIYADFKLDGDDEGEWTSVTGIRTQYTAVLAQVAEETGDSQYTQFANLIPSVDTFLELPDNYEYILSQYDILASSYGETELTDEQLREVFGSKDSIIMVLGDSSISDLTLAQMGYFTQEEFLAYAKRAKALAGDGSADTSEYDELVKSYLEGKEYGFFLDGEGESTFRWYSNDTIYSGNESPLYSVPVETDSGGYDTVTAPFKYNVYASDFEEDRDTADDVELKVKVILQKKSSVNYGCLESGMYYTKALADHALTTGRASKVVEYIEENGALAGMPYYYSYWYEGAEYSLNYGLFENSSSSSNMMASMLSMMMSGGSGSGSGVFDSYKVYAAELGGATLPSSFSIYPIDFDSKNLVTDYLDGWNDMCETGETYNGVTLTSADKIEYTDTIGLIMSMVDALIDMITTALIVFTALSLVVSTVMIGIITYVSVVERIKEIGILRSVGARKKDIKRLFNAETFIIGLAAGLVGILITYLLSLVVNLIVGSVVGIYTIASLPIWQAAVMICVSIALTLISGLIPASAAAKKDPVVALRTE